MRWARFGFAFDSCDAGWRVLDAGVSVELPRLDGDFPVCATDGFLLVLFDATEMRLAAFGFFGEAAGAGDNWGWGDVSTAEQTLPVCVVGSRLAGPAACVCGAVALTR